MMVLFYLTALVAFISTVMVITRLNAVHALLYLVISLLSVAFIFYLMGAAFIAAMEVIIYAGAIMILFIFVVMMLNLGKEATNREKTWLQTKMWTGPAILALIIAGELMYVILTGDGQPVTANQITPKDIGIRLYGTYLIGVELAAMLLLAGLVGAFHLGGRKRRPRHRFLQEEGR